jgi:tetratricopeptide (TPR) repeat protein
LLLLSWTFVKSLWNLGHTRCGRGATLATLTCLLLALFTTDARAESFVRRLAERALERGMAQEERGDIAQALTSYDEAVRTDSTLGTAALRLGGLRERMGDPEEAELLYTRALSAPDSAAIGYFARGMLRNAANRRREATADVAEAVALSPQPAWLRVLGGWYVEARLWPAALATWRALAASAEATGNQAELREARLTVAALSWLAGDTDPVLSGMSSSDWVRRSLSRAARPAAREAHGVRKLTP